MAQKTKSGTGKKKKGSSSAARTGAGKSAVNKSSARRSSSGRSASSASRAGNGRKSSSGRSSSRTATSRRAAAVEKARRQERQRKREIRMDIALVVMLIVMVFVYISLAGFGGSVGIALGKILFGLFGIGAWCVPVWVFLLCICLITDQGSGRMPVRLLAGAILILILQSAGHLYLHNAGRLSLDAPYSIRTTFAMCADNSFGGGILGGWFARLMYRAFGVPGSILVYIGMTIVALILLAQQSPAGALRIWQERREEAGIPPFSERQAMRRERRQQEREAREEERIAREADRILRREDRAAARADRSEEVSGPGGKRRGTRSARRASNASSLDLEHTLLDDKNAASAGSGKTGKKKGRGKGSGKGAGSVESLDRRKDVHEIIVLPPDEEDGLMTAASAGAPISGQFQVFDADFDPYEEIRPEEAVSAGSRDEDYFAGRQSGDDIYGKGPEVLTAEGSGSNRRISEPAAVAVIPSAARSDAVSSAGRPAGSDTVSSAAGPYTVSSAAGSDTLSSAAGSEAVSSAAGREAVPFADADGPKERRRGRVSDAGKDGRAGTIADAKAGRGTDALSSADAQSAAGFSSPSEEDLQGISVHRETDDPRTAARTAGRAAARKSSSYVPPTFSLLERGTSPRSDETERELKETAYRLQETLRTFGVQVTITDISQGPSVTRYELKPDKGVKVSKIVNLSDDIKLRLAATDIRIEAPIPGKSAIGIEVPNKNETTVHLRELLESREFRRFEGKLPFAVGKDIGGKTIIADIARMPHLLIAGATGSGKSVCINTIILSILYRTSPEKVRLLMIDPKVVELSVYKKIPHLIIPVVTDARKASAALNWAVAEMEKRYKLFAAAGARDLNGYNALAASYRNEDGELEREPLPRIVIIVDELADLMMVAKSEVESAICRLAQLARAAGIHLIIATQRPSVDVITGLIKANMPSRIAFAVSSQVDSRTILDMAGAEKLIGRGDMLFYPQNYQKPARIQGAFVSDEEVTTVVDYIKKHNTVEMHDEEIDRQIEDIALNGVSAVSTGEVRADPGRDEHFAEAGRFIIEKNKASIGLLQRVFKIGFNRAARIMDQLAEAGVVSEESSTRARQVLMTMPEFEAFLENEG